MTRSIQSRDTSLDKCRAWSFWYQIGRAPGIGPSSCRTVAAFLTAAQAQGASMGIIDVANGQHGFDTLDHTDDSRRAVSQALSWVTSALRPTDRRSG